MAHNKGNKTENKENTENKEYTENTEENEETKPHRKKLHLGFFYLFLFVFIFALILSSYAFKMYSPNIDISLGEKEDTPINYSDIDYEIKPIDERLKWIQKEDEMPTVSVKKENDDEYKELLNDLKNKAKEEKEKASEKKNSEKNQKSDTVESKKEITPGEPATLSLSDSIISQKKSKQTKEPAVTITKVYLGNYETLDEAIEIQHKISSLGLAVSPFVKAVNDHFIVQVGSFYEAKKADDLIISLKTNGYNAKKKIEK